MCCLRSCLLCFLLIAGLVAVESPPSGDLREVLAETTRARDELAARVDGLEHQRGLLIVVAGLLTLAVGVLVRAQLRVQRKKKGTATVSVEEIEIDESDPFQDVPADVATASTVTVRKNATITIRNGATQREEVTEQVQTRRLFSSGERRRTPRHANTVPDPSRQETASPHPSATMTPARGTRIDTDRAEPGASVSPRRGEETTEPDPAPSTDRLSRNADGTGANQAEGPRRPVTVRADHQSDRMEVVEVTVKPGTTGIYRRQAFTLLEVMISLALLATVLSSVAASTFTLHRSRQLAQEEAESHMLARLFVERIMAESFGNLHDSVVGSLWKANYADDATAVPLTAQALKDKNIVEELPALADLKVYLEYYPQAALETAIRTRQPMVLTNRLGWRDRTLVFRIVIDWTGCDGNPRRHVQLFVRSE
jgi:prepilin-type N-terminal cleavage/methylation domain-containing protein